MPLSDIQGLAVDKDIYTSCALLKSISLKNFSVKTINSRFTALHILLKQIKHTVEIYKLPNTKLMLRLYRVVQQKLKDKCAA